MNAQIKNLLRWLWPLLLVFLPTWLANLVLLPPEVAATWNPLTIAARWPQAVQALFGYAPGFAGGACFSLVVCAFWYVRSPGLLNAVLLFSSAAMAGPSWLLFLMNP